MTEPHVWPPSQLQLPNEVKFKAVDGLLIVHHRHRLSIPDIIRCISNHIERQYISPFASRLTLSVSPPFFRRGRDVFI